MSTPLTACRKCGSTTFYVHESYTLAGEIDPDTPGVIMVSGHSDGGVDDVVCAECGAEPEGYRLEFG